MNLSVALGLVIIAALAALCYAAFSFFKVKKLEEEIGRAQSELQSQGTSRMPSSA